MPEPTGPDPRLQPPVLPLERGTEWMKHTNVLPDPIPETAEQTPMTPAEVKIRELAERARSRGFGGAGSELDEFATTVHEKELQISAEMREAIEAAYSQYILALAEAISALDTGLDEVEVKINANEIFTSKDVVKMKAFEELLATLMSEEDAEDYLKRVRGMVKDRKDSTSSNGSYVDRVTDLDYDLFISDDENHNLKIDLHKRF